MYVYVTSVKSSPATSQAGFQKHLLTRTLLGRFKYLFRGCEDARVPAKQFGQHNTLENQTTACVLVYMHFKNILTN